MSSLLGSHFANLWMTLLSTREFLYKYKKENGSVHYGTGQPMGALTSWSFGLSLYHHSLVQFAAYRAGLTGWFDNYALLGDDIVIADNRVAKEYLSILSQLGVTCGIAKSLVSSKGLALEFAKRFYYQGKNCSPIAMKEVLSSINNFGASVSLAEKYILPLKYYLSLLGYGYKSLSLIASPLRR
jgi:hypothetical protein